MSDDNRDFILFAETAQRWQDWKPAMEIISREVNQFSPEAPLRFLRSLKSLCLRYKNNSVLLHLNGELHDGRLKSR